jgi:hypothetical protein
MSDLSSHNNCNWWHNHLVRGINFWISVRCVIHYTLIDTIQRVKADHFLLNLQQNYEQIENIMKQTLTITQSLQFSCLLLKCKVLQKQIRSLFHCYKSKMTLLHAELHEEFRLCTSSEAGEWKVGFSCA